MVGSTSALNGNGHVLSKPLVPRVVIVKGQDSFISICTGVFALYSIGEKLGEA